MSTHTIEISGVSDELLRRLDAKVREQNAPDRSAYILEVLTRETETEGDQEGPASAIPRNRFREILAPIHAETERLGLTDEEIDESVEEARQAYWREHRQAASVEAQ